MNYLKQSNPLALSTSLVAKVALYLRPSCRHRTRYETRGRGRAEAVVEEFAVVGGGGGGGSLG